MIRFLTIAVIALGLANCSGDASPQPDGEKIDCAIGAGADFARVCIAERAMMGDQAILIIHHPDGSFQRFDILEIGQGLALGDGAGELRQQIGEDSVQIDRDGARYSIPSAILRQAEGG